MGQILQTFYSSPEPISMWEFTTKYIYVNNGPSFQILLLSVFYMVADKNTDMELKNSVIVKAAYMHHAVGKALPASLAFAKLWNLL